MKKLIIRKNHNYFIFRLQLRVERGFKPSVLGVIMGLLEILEKLRKSEPEPVKIRTRESDLQDQILIDLMRSEICSEPEQPCFLNSIQTQKGI
ncbi:hypothetical protein [Vibrio phage Va2]|nr:hypothetical protein [Vibrio phage Va2]